MNRNLPAGRLFAIFLLLSAFLSCDVRDKAQPTASEGTISLAPRLVAANGDSVLTVDSVRFVVTYGNVTIKNTVKFSDHHIQFGGIPIDAHWTMSVEGLHKAVDGRRLVLWWSGRDTGTAIAGPQAVQWTNTLVNLGDTATPRFLDVTGIPSATDSLPFNTQQVSISFKVADTDTVYLNDTALKAVTNSPGSYAFTSQVPSTQRIELVSPSGNVSITTLAYKVSKSPVTDTTTPTIKFLTPSTDIRGARR